MSSMLARSVGADISDELEVGPDLFVVYRDFDVGLGVAFVTCTLLAFDPDGETIGPDIARR